MNLQMPDLAQQTKLITCNVEGILEADDLALLVSGLASDEPSAASLAKEVDDPSDLRRVREKHHTVARMIANGMNQRLVASICSYTESYISILLNNPAMQELVEHYRIQKGNAAEVIGEKLRAVALDAVEKLADKMHEGEGLGANELIQLAKLGLDRSGHGPTSKQEVIKESHIFDHAALNELNRRAREGSKEFIVNPETVRQVLLPQPAPSDDEEGEAHAGD